MSPPVRNLAGGVDSGATDVVPMPIASDGRPRNAAENVRPLPCECGYQWDASSYPYPHDICCHASGEYVVVCLRCKACGPLKARPDWAISAWNDERSKPDALTLLTKSLCTLQALVSNMEESGEAVQFVARRLERCFTSMPDRMATEQVMLDEQAKGTLPDFSRELAQAAITAVLGTFDLEALKTLVGEIDDVLGGEK